MKKTLLLFILVCLLACKDQKNEVIETVTSDELEVENASVEITEPKGSAIAQLLQGTWVNEENSRSSLVFEKNRVINRYDGLANDTRITFTVGDSCNNKNNPEGSNEKDKYISTAGDALECYYIQKLTESTLILDLMGHSITLTFKKE